MPSSSHAKCKVCRKIIHARHRFGMCKQCSDKHYARLTAQRKETQARRARREAAIQAALSKPIVLEEGPDMAEFQTTADTPDKPERPGRKPRNLTPEQEVEILDAYTQTSESVNDLTARFGVKATYIYNVLDRVGVSWRRGNPESYETWQARQAKPANDSVPPETEKALENMLRLPVVPPKPEPVAPTPAVERRARPSNVDSLVWAVTVQGVLLIDAVELEDAIAQVRRQQPGLRITKVELSQ